MRTGTLAPVTAPYFLQGPTVNTEDLPKLAHVGRVAAKSVPVPVDSGPGQAGPLALWTWKMRQE